VLEPIIRGDGHAAIPLLTVNIEIIKINNSFFIRIAIIKITNK